MESMRQSRLEHKQVQVQLATAGYLLRQNDLMHDEETCFMFSGETSCLTL